MDTDTLKLALANAVNKRWAEAGDANRIAITESLTKYVLADRKVLVALVEHWRSGVQLPQLDDAAAEWLLHADLDHDQRARGLVHNLCWSYIGKIDD
jgi:hypothetical protein